MSPLSFLQSSQHLASLKVKRTEEGKKMQNKEARAKRQEKGTE